MSDTVLSGRWTVYYEAENRQKRVTWSGGAASPDTVRSLYLALQDLFDELNQMDDGVPMKADTPTEYQIGIIDPGDDDPWFIDPESVEHLRGGAIKTANWKRVQDSNTGIVRVSVSSSNIVAGDIGYDITHGDGDAGTLLDVRDLGGSTGELWIRPDSDAAANNFDSVGGTLTCNAHTATQGPAATTGDMSWANIYNTGIATLVADTHLYIYQGAQGGDTAPDAKLSGYKSTWNWWADGTFDILVMVADQSSDLTDAGTFIDNGYLTVLARQYKRTYSYYIVDLSGGGRNPIPLETGNDLNNPTGYKTVSLTSSSGNWNINDEIEGATSEARGIITSTSGANPTITLRYYLIDDLTDFQNGETIDNNDDTGTGTSGTPADYGPALLSGLSITHGANNTFDIDEDGTNEYYSIVVDVSDETLANAYEWSKYETMRGEAGVANHNGIEGEQYLGSDYRITYTALNGTIGEGHVVTQSGSGARATVVAHHTTPDILILRNSRGTFDDAGQIDAISGYVTGPTSESITPIKADPYGLFAGGVWFAAPGVVFDNVLTADENNYQLVDDEGNTVEAPTKVAVTVTNTRIKDRVALFRLTAAGGQIKKDEYTIDTAGHSKGDDTIKVDPDITADTPGKTAGGILFVRDVSGFVEHRYRYSSWSGDVFTLTQATGTATGGDTDTLNDSGASFTSTVKVGDIVRSITDDDFGYVVEVVSDTELTTTTMSLTWNGKQYATNDVVEAYSSSDYVYVPIIHVYETAGTDGSPGNESISMVYSADVPVRLRARHANDTSYNIKPFETDGTIESTGISVAVIRTPETITS